MLLTDCSSWGILVLWCILKPLIWHQSVMGTYSMGWKMKSWNISSVQIVSGRDLVKKTLLVTPDTSEMRGGYHFLRRWLVGTFKSLATFWWAIQVLRYDDGSLAILQDANQLEKYVVQNSSQDIRRKRQIRLALRALEGKTVRWPYQHVTVRLLLFKFTSKTWAFLVSWCALFLAFTVLQAEPLPCGGIQAISNMHITDQATRASCLGKNAAGQWLQYSVKVR